MHFIQLQQTMNNEQSIANKNPLQFIVNGSEESRSYGMGEITQKREEFRKQIRKQQLDKYFRTKRMLHFSTPHKKTLTDCLMAIQTNINVEQNVCSLVNILALEKPFQKEKFTTLPIQITPQVIEQFCTKVVDLMLNKTIPNFQKYPKGRIFCINALSNLFADKLCPNARYVEIVIQTIEKMYGGLDIWGLDDEMTEVFYMIGNLMRKNISHTKLMNVERILSWVEAGLMQLPSDPLKSLTEGVTQVFTDIDTRYNSSNSSLFTEHFRSNREIILEIFIKRLIQTAHASKLTTKGTLSLDPLNIQYIFRLLNKNKQYVLRIFQGLEEDMQDRNLKFQFMQKILVLLNQQILKKQVVVQIGSFLVELLKFYPIIEEDEETGKNDRGSNKETYKQQLNQIIIELHRYFLRKEVLKNIFMGLIHQNIDCKNIYLRVIRRLLQTIYISLNVDFQSQDLLKSLRYILIDMQLQVILVDFIADIDNRLKDNQMLESIIHIYEIVIRAGKGKLGQKIKHQFETLISQETSILSKGAFTMIDGLIGLHNQKIDSCHVQKRDDFFLSH